MREGSLEAPVRHPIDWRNPDFYDEQKLDEELRRVFDICHGCRRCFNLCDSFPRLFDLIDEGPTGELEGIDSKDFRPVVDACTLCDMCFMTKCPYVPPHEFNLDFPHLMLRYRAVQAKKGEIPAAEKQLTRTDRNGRIGVFTGFLANWGARLPPARAALETVAGVHREAYLPPFAGKTFAMEAAQVPVYLDETAPAFGRKAVLYATCFANYNTPEIGMAARAVLAKNGVETEIVYPECCGMPQLEHGELDAVAGSAANVSARLRPWIEKGYDVVALVPSCALMLKFEWPLLVPENEDVKRLSQASFDISEYVMDIARKEGLAPGMAPIDDGVTVHIACHARAQNMGQKAAEMLRLIPDAKVDVIERCSGHGGSWGVMKDNFEVGMKVGRPASRQALSAKNGHVCSECPLAGAQIVQGMERLGGNGAVPKKAESPIQIVAKAYGL